MTTHIHDLAMPEGKFEIAVAAKETPGKTGKDELTFLFTANLGEPIRPLLKVASGGELSRVALAIKTVLLNASGVPTMVFDEIDTGVGGVTAQKMAEKIAVIAKVGQVLCITHLPQIASFADRHILIRKESAGGRTSTGLTTLDEEGRIQELMRMTVGDNVSELQQAADVITEYCRSQGYTVATAFLPQQDIQNGVVEIRVLLGTLGEVRIDNQSRLSAEQAASFLSSASGRHHQKRPAGNSAE